MIDNEKNKDSFEYGSLSFKGDVPHFDGDDDDAIDIVKKKRRAPSAVSKKRDVPRRGTDAHRPLLTPPPPADVKGSSLPQNSILKI